MPFLNRLAKFVQIAKLMQTDDKQLWKILKELLGRYREIIF